MASNSDISKFLSATGIQLKNVGYGEAGKSAEKYAQGALGQIFGKASNTDPTSADRVLRDMGPDFKGEWSPTPYAAAFSSGAGHYDPKTKFLFKVKFEFSPGLTQLASSMGYNLSDISNNLSFVVKSMDAPKIQYDYQAVNMYGHHTKVLKHIEFREISMAFFDDTGNHSTSFVNIYMQLLSPVARMRGLPAGLNLNDFSMAMPPDLNPFATNTNTRSVLPGNANNILARMIVEQYYLQRETSGSSKADKAVYMNSYEFLNPRIINLDFADLDHSSSDISLVTTTIDFDSFNLLVGQSATNRAITEFAAGDILKGSQPTDKTGKPEGKFNNPFVNVIASQTSKFAQNSVSKGLGKMLGPKGSTIFGKSIYSISEAVGGSVLTGTKNVGADAYKNATAYYKSATAPTKTASSDNSSGGDASGSNTGTA